MVVPEAGGFSPEHAGYVLSLDFPPDQHALAAELSAKAQASSLSADEQRVLDTLIFADTLLGLMRAKATASLLRQSAPQQHQQPAA